MSETKLVVKKQTLHAATKTTKFFSGLQPNVFDVIDEYLLMNESYPTSMSIIRTHLFNLLSRVFEVKLFIHVLC